MLVIIKNNENFIIRRDDEPETHTFKIDMQGTIYGYKGRPVANLPKGFKKTDFVFNNMDGIENQYKNLLSKIVCGESYECISLYERLLNTGLKNFSIGTYSSTLPKRKTFSQWLKLAREYEQQYPQKQYTLQTLIHYEEDKKFLQAENMQDIITYYGEDFAHNIYKDFQNKWNKVSKWLSDDNLYKAIKFFDCSSYSIKRIFTEMFKWSELLNIKLSNKKPIDQYLKLEKQFKLHQDEIANLTLKAHQNQAWVIEDDNFTIIVPTSMNELIYEGKHNHNCVGDYWTYSYGNQLKRGTQKRGIIFIRKKDNPNKSFITCDFDLVSFDIRQYLSTCNSVVQDKKALAFKKKLQKHLHMFA